MNTAIVIISAVAVLAIATSYPARALWQEARAAMEQDELDQRSLDHSASDVWSVLVIARIKWRRLEAAWLRENSTLLHLWAGARAAAADMRKAMRRPA